MLKVIKRVFIITFIIGILAIAAVILINEYVEKVGEKYVRTIEEVEAGDAIIVLGAYVSPTGRVSDMLADRLEVGYQLYKKGKAPKILVSGDHGTKGYDEVNAMREYLEKKGVPSRDIFMDHAGFNTYDSIYRARDVFMVEKPIIVSQYFHVVRAAYIADRLGVDAQAVTSDLRQYRTIGYSNLREYGARTKAFIQAGIFKPKPKFLGKAIPVSGDGKQTAG